MQRFTNNLFSIRKNRFNESGAKFESVYINNVVFANSLFSLNNKDLFFTNFAKSKNQKVYQIIEEFYDKIKNSNFDILKSFVFDEIYYKEKVIERLISIINISSGWHLKISDLPRIYKLKNQKDAKIHMYIVIDDNLVYVLLIDLYHLTFPADIIKKGKLIKRGYFDDLFKVYEKFKDNRCNLNNITNKELLNV